MTRAEHLAAAKARARERLKARSPIGALSSMIGDLKAHPETREHPAITDSMLRLQLGELRTEAEVGRWIEELA